MADTTIKVTTGVRDRLAVIAKQRGRTIGELVAELAARTPTREELDARRAEAATYIREHLVADFDDGDLAAGERFWQRLADGRATAG